MDSQTNEHKRGYYDRLFWRLIWVKRNYQNHKTAKSTIQEAVVVFEVIEFGRNIKKFLCESLWNGFTRDPIENAPNYHREQGPASWRRRRKDSVVLNRFKSNQ